MSKQTMHEARKQKTEVNHSLTDSHHESTYIVSVSEVCKILNIGRNTVYRLLQNNVIKHVRVGRKYLIPKKSVIGFIEKFCYNNDQIINGRLNLVKKGDVDCDREPTNKGYYVLCCSVLA